MKQMRLRKVWLKIHLWLGLTAGLVFVLLGVTGSVLVFHRALDRWLEPEILLTAEGDAQRSLDEVLAAAEQAYPASQAEFADAPTSADDVWTVWFKSGTKASPEFTHVYVDPYTAEVTGTRVRGKYLMTWIYLLHVELLAGETGKALSGVVGLLMLVSLATGIYLWWPLWKNSWRAALAIRGGRRFNFDLHKTGGMASSAVLLVVTFSGVYLVFPHWFKPLGKLVAAESASAAKSLKSTPLAGQKPIGAERAVAAAQEVFPDAELKRLYLPAEPEKPYIVRVRRAGEVRRSSGNSRVWVDQYSGEVLGVRDWNQSNAAETFFGWQFPLHNGEAFGLAGRWIVFVSGLAPAMLYVTGFVLWWRKRQSRKRQGKSVAKREKREESSDARPPQTLQLNQ